MQSILLSWEIVFASAAKRRKTGSVSWIKKLETATVVHSKSTARHLAYNFASNTSFGTSAQTRKRRPIGNTKRWQTKEQFSSDDARALLSVALEGGLALMFEFQYVLYKRFPSKVMLIVVL